MASKRPNSKFVMWLDRVSNQDIEKVGGKNASLGEMIKKLKKNKIKVPEGFATTVDAYHLFIKNNNLKKKILSEITKFRNNKQSLSKTGSTIRGYITQAEFPDEIKKDIEKFYEHLCRSLDQKNCDVAVRSSATAEDLPGASFAGQLETFLNVSGKKELLKACQKCLASLFTDRAISYRENKDFDHMKVGLSVCVQRMIRSDLAGSGVMFTIDTDSGFPNVVVINATWGLGENVVQGVVTPDEYLIFKPTLNKKNTQSILEKICGKKMKKMIYAKGGRHTTKNIRTTKKERSNYVLNNDEIIQLAKWGVIIEKHYKKPMDIEWAKDGKTDTLYIVQARPETVHTSKKIKRLKQYQLKQKGNRLLSGQAIGQAIATGKVQVIKSAKAINQFKEGNILVTEMTDPDWVPIMKKASGIITDHGGRTSHAAIVSRELDVPALVGTENATKKLKKDQLITLSCAEGQTGYVYSGELKYTQKDIDLDKIPKIKTKVMINIATPLTAFHWWQLPCDGIGLARMEFIISNIIKIHPMALIHFSKVKAKTVRNEIKKLTEGYQEKSLYFVDHLVNGIAKIAASQYPKPVIVRMSDFKSNEYANLIGGQYFESEETNPMIGVRGASRYYRDHYRSGFELECRAIKYLRDVMGFTNIILMIPFCRTLEEADKVLKILAKNGLKRGKNQLQIYIMCEIPSNIVLGEQFAEKFDGFSIGSNDLTQLVLGVARDSDELSDIFDENNPAVKKMIQEIISKAHKKKRKVSLCGQAPSDNPKFAEFLVQSRIDSISLNPDSILTVIKRIAKIEK